MEFLKKALPWIGAAATGNVPALIGMAAKVVSEVLGEDIQPAAEAIANAVAGATPEQLASLKEKELEFKAKMQELGFKHVEEMQRLQLEEAQAYMFDTQHARDRHAQNTAVFRLGALVLLSFGLAVGFSMWGSYLLLTKGLGTDIDPGVVAAVFGFLGTVIGYLAANAQQVIGFFFGSSKGSGDKTDAMVLAFQQLSAKATKQK